MYRIAKSKCLRCDAKAGILLPFNIGKWRCRECGNGPPPHVSNDEAVAEARRAREATQIAAEIRLLDQLDVRQLFTCGPGPGPGPDHYLSPNPNQILPCGDGLS